MSLAGALLYALQPGSPAEQSLAVGEVVTSVDGRSVDSDAEFAARLERFSPGDTVTMTVFTFPSGKPKQVRVRLSAWRLRIQGKGKKATETLICPLYGTDLRLPIEHISPDAEEGVRRALHRGPRRGDELSGGKVAVSHRSFFRGDHRPFGRLGLHTRFDAAARSL